MLQAARRLFAARGYAGISNREVAGAAGLAHTAIYNHFGSKAQLFTAVFLDVQDLLVAELDRSVAAAPDEPAFPRALLDAIEALMAEDPSYVEFLASMYVEVRRHPELAEVFHGAGGATFSVVQRLTELAGEVPLDDTAEGANAALWFWIAFALGLAQLGTLADPAGFSATISAFREHFGSVPSFPRDSVRAGRERS